MSSEYAFGTKVIIFDPEREYVELTSRPYFSGEVIDGAGGGQGRINPLQIRTASKVETEEGEET